MDNIVIEGLIILMQNIWIVPIGVALGMLIGATPGLSASNSLAMLLPVIFVMPPEKGIVFIIAVHAGSQMGNSFPAILLNIPGTPSSAITALEGYPLMNKGEAGKAVGICVMASAIGALIGAFLTMIFAPTLAIFALRLSPVEITIIILFGIVIIGQVSEGGLPKALLAGFFGLLLATAGIDPIYGQTRGSFGSVYLFDGLPLVPCLVGLLAFSEILKMIKDNTDAKEQIFTNQVVGAKEIISGFKEVIKRPVDNIRSSLIGLVIGAIPGAGGSVAAFVAYQQAMSFASEKESKLFGKGSPSGLIAADSSNNAMVGGSLVPLMTLGIPGCNTGAILLIAMSYQGIYLGPQLFTVNGDIAYAALWSLFAGAFAIVLIGTIFAYFASKVVNIDKKVLIPVISALALVGGFATREFVFDMGIVVAFGLLGLLMKKYNYTPIALLLGLILGTNFEANMFRGLKMGFGSPMIFFERPIAIVLWTLLILSLVIPIHFKKRREQAKADKSY